MRVGGPVIPTGVLEKSKTSRVIRHVGHHFCQIESKTCPSAKVAQFGRDDTCSITRHKGIFDLVQSAWAICCSRSVAARTLRRPSALSIAWRVSGIRSSALSLGFNWGTAW